MRNAMKRLAVNSMLAGIAVGLGLYVIGRLAIAVQKHADFNEWTAATGFFLLGWGVMFPALFIQGVFGLATEGRLRNHFRLQDLSPAQPAYERTMKLIVPAKQFLAEMHQLIAHTFTVLSFADDWVNENCLTYRIRYRMQLEYEIRIRVAARNESSSIRVRRISAIARFSTVELAGAQLLAGLIKWAADRCIVVQDFAGSPSRNRLAKDLGNWLPNPKEWQPTMLDPDAPLPPIKFWDGTYDIPRARLFGAMVVALAAFLGIASLDRPGFRVPRLIKTIPLLIFFGYFSAQLKRSMTASQKHRRGGGTEHQHEHGSQLR